MQTMSSEAHACTSALDIPKNLTYANGVKHIKGLNPAYSSEQHDPIELLAPPDGISTGSCAAATQSMIGITQSPHIFTIENQGSNNIHFEPVRIRALYGFLNTARINKKKGFTSKVILLEKSLGYEATTHTLTVGYFDAGMGYLAKPNDHANTTIFVNARNPEDFFIGYFARRAAINDMGIQEDYWDTVLETLGSLYGINTDKPLQPGPLVDLSGNPLTAKVAQDGIIHP